MAVRGLVWDRVRKRIPYDEITPLRASYEADF